MILIEGELRVFYDIVRSLECFVCRGDKNAVNTRIDLLLKTIDKDICVIVRIDRHYCKIHSFADIFQRGCYRIHQRNIHHVNIGYFIGFSRRKVDVLCQR